MWGVDPLWVDKQGVITLWDDWQSGKFCRRFWILVRKEPFGQRVFLLILAVKHLSVNCTKRYLFGKRSHEQKDRFGPPVGVKGS